MHRSSFAARILFHAVLLGAVCCGCKQGTDPAVFESAEQALIAGSEAFKNRQYQDSVNRIDEALAQGGLMADTYSQALFVRAKAQAHLGNYAAAHTDLDEAERGADMAEVHRVRSFVFAKEGKKSKSADEYSKAKRLNPSVRPISD